MILQGRTPDVVRLRDGNSVVIRPVRPFDKAAFVDAFERLSPQTRRRRFCAAKIGLTHAELRYFTEVDHVDHAALVAADCDGRGVGVARYVRDTHERSRAEFAIVVCDAWQRRGVGTALSHRLVVRARAAGIRIVTADHLADNHAIVSLLRALGPVRLGPVSAGARTAEIDLVAACLDRDAAPDHGQRC